MRRIRIEDGQRVVAQVWTRAESNPADRLTLVERVEVFPTPQPMPGTPDRMVLVTVVNSSSVAWSDGVWAGDTLRVSGAYELDFNVAIRAPLASKSGKLPLRLQVRPGDGGALFAARLTVAGADVKDRDLLTALRTAVFRIEQTDASPVGPSRAPYLLDLEQWVSGAPRGRHVWRHRFTSTGPYWALRTEYACDALSEPPPRSGWWQGRKPTSVLTGLDLAIQGGREERRFDVATTHQPSPESSDGSSLWALEVVWRGALAPDGAEVDSPLDLWNRKFAAPYQRSLHTARSRQPASVVPTLHLEDLRQAGDWHLEFRLTDRQATSNDLQKDHFAVRPASVDIEAGTVTCEARLDSFLDHEGCPVRRQVQLAADKTEPDDRGLRWRVAVTDQASAHPGRQTSRVGALDLAFRVDAAVGLSQAGFLEGSLTTVRSVPPRCDLGDAEALTVPFLRARLGWHLRAFGPGGQDAVVTDRDAIERPRSLVIPWNSNVDREVAGDFLLHCTESSTPDRDQSLALRLEDLGRSRDRSDKASALPQAASDTATTGDLDFVVLDPAPLLVARVASSFATGSLGELGNWSGGDVFGGSWELSGTEPLRLFLPPQAVGEEALKDYEKQAAAGPRRLDYRFGPTALARLSRTPFDQAFAEAPWNLRRLFGFPGQRLPGTELLELHWELLYGLSASVTHPHLMLAELGARLGHPVGALPSVIDRWLGGVDPLPDIVDAYRIYVQRFEEQLRLLASRLAYLELWNRHAEAEPFEISEVDYRFRTSRRTADPLAPIEVDPKAPWSGGLRGGVDWGFESRNIYDEVLASESSSGALARAALTSLGGFGFQRAGFARDKTKILSDTFLGRTFFYSLERIGRVGVAWNRAKHVIIYERSAAASQQFPDKGRHFRGRVALRKVREFVEILEPERTFPDGAGGGPERNATAGELERRRGFVLACKFPQPILPVTSEWARDIPGGWVVPLYQPGFDPEVYPEPEIFLALDSLEGKDERIVWGRIKDPEKLLFYTSTDPEHDDRTDLWPSVVQVDFPPESPPVRPRIEAIDPRRPDANLPDAPPVEPGYEAFSWHLDTGGRRANLATARQQQGTEALVESVTMLRRGAAVLGEPPSGTFRADAGNLRGTLAGAGPALAEEAQALRGALSARDPRGRIAAARKVIERQAVAFEGSVKSLEIQVEAVRQSFPVKASSAVAGGTAPAAAPAAAGPAESLVRAHLEALQADLQEIWQKVRGELEEKFEKEVRATLAEIARHPDQAKERLRQRLETLAADFLIRAERRIRTAEVAWSGALKQLQRAVSVFDRQCPELVAELLREAENLLAAILDARRDRDAARWVATALRTLRGIETKLAVVRRGLGPVAPEALFGVQRELSKAITRLLDARAAIEGDDADFERFVAEDLEPAVRRLVRTLEASCEDLRGALDRLGFDEARTWFDARLRDLRDRIQAWLDDLDVGGDLDRQLEQLLGAVHDAFDSMGELFASARNHLATIGEDLSKLLGEPLQLAEAWRRRGEEIRRRWQAVVGAFEGGWESLLDVEDVRREVDDLIASAGGLLDEVNDVLGSSLTEALQRITIAELPNLPKLGDPGLWLARAFGESPVAETLRLNRDRIGYYLGQLSDRIDLTPVTALFNRAGRELEQLDLKTLGIRLPTVSLGDRFQPALDQLAKIDLGDLLPDFAGINLDKLLAGIGIPSGTSDGVDVTHGFDPRQRRAWAEAVIQAPFQRVELVQLGPVIVRLVRGKFDAQARLEVSAEGATRRNVNAVLTADWQLEISGFSVLVFADSSLRFDNDGRLRFETSPQKIRMHQALNFITGLLGSYQGPEGSGLSFELIRQDGGLPIGARAVLSVLLPPLQTGAFSMSNLALRGQLEVAAPSTGFYIAAGGSLASKERPFNLSIMCLGGGGWFTALAVYKPFEPGSRQLSGWLSVGLSVGASLPFDVGVASGGVYFLISVGVEGSLARGSGGLSILLRVAVWGEVVILGIVSIHILLALEAEYQGATGSLLCRGILRAKVKLGWMWEISVSKTVTYRLAGSGRSGSQAPSLAAASLGLDAGGAGPGSAGAAAVPPEVRSAASYASEQYLLTFAGDF